MNITFFGSSHFAEPALRALIANGYKVSCVVTQPDKKKGRGMSLGHTLIKDTAREFKLKVFQPDNVNSLEAIETLKSFKPDLFVVLAYGQLLSQELLDIPKIVPVNVHASLLPAYRGAAPINWAIIKGEKITGNTLMKIALKMDSGPIILQKETSILDNDTAISLEERLSLEAAELLIRGLESIQADKYSLTPQDENNASLAPKLKKEDGLIDWNKSAQEIYNLIRGALSWPGAFTYYRGKVLKIYQVIVYSTDGLKNGVAPGEVIRVAKEGISVAAAEGILSIQDLQIEGKKRMPVQEFILGHKITAGENFGKNSCKQ